ncbi:hypothetical protein FB45DRAFT_1111374 [Roridomyces roridus]|uniref:CCHC-type domain-containing protein n=1 Tax=Roridomyces roridus TaxID=1738132 RepID=A0AAD7B9H2_9AGAR|nr:hypothetical protein FB45DRAFT_1111374 [Roridomyces roridus]
MDRMDHPVPFRQSTTVTTTRMVGTRVHGYCLLEPTARILRETFQRKVAEVGSSFNGSNEDAGQRQVAEVGASFEDSSECACRGSSSGADRCSRRMKGESNASRVSSSGFDTRSRRMGGECNTSRHRRSGTMEGEDSGGIGDGTVSARGIESDGLPRRKFTHAARDWMGIQDGFVLPRVVTKKSTHHIPRRVERVTDSKFFPRWFGSGNYENHLSTAPQGTWNLMVENGTQSVTKGYHPEPRVEFMAISVESVEHKQKGVRKSREPKPYFVRPASQMPEGGWFRKTISEDPPDIPSSSSSSSSSEDSSSGDSHSSQVEHSGRLNKHAARKCRDRKKRAEARQMRRATKGLEIQTPFVWDGKPELDLFDHWTFTVDQWQQLTGLTDKFAIKLIVNFMSGKASRFFMDHVASDMHKWTIKGIYRALFDHCFPTDIKQRLRRKLLNTHQGNTTVRDFVRDIKSLARRFPDVGQQQLVQILWDGAVSYVRVKWLEKGLSPEDTSFERLEKWALRYESAHEALEMEKSHWESDKEARRTWEYTSETSETDDGNSMEDSSDSSHSEAEDSSGRQATGTGRRNASDRRPMGSRTRLSAEDKDALRAEGRCFNCREVGHQERNCPERHEVSVGAARYEYSDSPGSESSSDEEQEGYWNTQGGDSSASDKD